MTLRSTLALTAHAFVLWALCGATMAIGLKVASLEAALVVHAVAAPLITAAVAAVYFRAFAGEATPVMAASWFVGFVVLVDFFVVALAINRSLDMFRSVLGTWLPFALIFAAAYLTGTRTRARAGASKRSAVAPAPRADS